MTLELRIALAALAVFRLAQLVVYDDGPWARLAKLRVWLAERDLPAVQAQRTPFGWGQLAECPYCWGLYLAVLATVPVLLPTPVGDAVLLVLGLAGAQALLQGLAERAA